MLKLGFDENIIKNAGDFLTLNSYGINNLGLDYEDSIRLIIKVGPDIEEKTEKKD